VAEIRVATDADLAELRVLFREYAAWVNVDLSFQDFDREVGELPGEYVAPGGVLFVAGVGDALAGCVAAHRWSAGVCEMKRLFVRAQFRGSGCGSALVESVIAWARQTGYGRILLDTLPSMGNAQRLYGQLGFREVAPYRVNPIPGAKFMALSLE